MKGFDPKWCRWIQEFITRGNVEIRVNDDIDHYFQTVFRNMSLFFKLGKDYCKGTLYTLYCSIV
jgi:hypothetical protein